MTIRMRVLVVIVCAAAAGAGLTTLQAGADPAPYTTLEQAASKPVGIGDPGVAEGVRGSRTDIAPAQVLRSLSAARGGCHVSYGKAGQCLPMVPPSQAEHVAAGHMKPRWECTELRSMFKAGISVRVAGADPLLLDKNRDGTACGKGD
jgi:hypothetical protein